MVRNYLLVLLLFLSADMFAQDITVLASTDTTDYLIGDYIKYTLQISTDQNDVVLTTGFRDSIANVEVISIDEPKVEVKENKKITTYNFTLSRYDSALVTIPGIPVYFRTGADAETNKLPLITPEQAANDPTIKFAVSNPVSFTVHSMKVNVQEEIKDVKDPVIIPLDWKIILMWILIGLLVLALLYYFYQKYWKKKEEQPRRKVIILPPHVIALNSLNELELKKLWQEGKVKEYHSEITEIIRKYFEERFKLAALELTTSEVMMHLRNTPGAEKIINTTYSFLSNADLVKFAKYTPLSSVNEEMMKQAYEIVNDTIPGKEEIKEVQEETNV